MSGRMKEATTMGFLVLVLIGAFAATLIYVRTLQTDALSKITKLEETVDKLRDYLDPNAGGWRTHVTERLERIERCSCAEHWQEGSDK